MAQLAQGLRFYLANPLARDVELLADFLEGVVAFETATCERSWSTGTYRAPGISVSRKP